LTITIGAAGAAGTVTARTEGTIGTEEMTGAGRVVEAEMFEIVEGGTTPSNCRVACNDWKCSYMC